MASFTYYSGNLVANKIFRNATLTTPSIYYLGISTTTIQKDGTGITEPTSDPAYTRIAIPANSTNFSSSSLGITTNLLEVEFPESTISQGVITDWFLSDSLTDGNVWFYGTLQTSRNVESSTILVLPVGSFQNTML